jgi:hypothetical protein
MHLNLLGYYLIIYYLSSVLWLFVSCLHLKLLQKVHRSVMNHVKVRYMTVILGMICMFLEPFVPREPPCSLHQGCPRRGDADNA